MDLYRCVYTETLPSDCIFSFLHIIVNKKKKGSGVKKTDIKAISVKLLVSQYLLVHSSAWM